MSFVIREQSSESEKTLHILPLATNVNGAIKGPKWEGDALRGHALYNESVEDKLVLLTDNNAEHVNVIIHTVDKNANPSQELQRLKEWTNIATILNE
ncbi:hypothetical protein DAMA08_022060 [Martiniozyma asiatica (nom. inval.)]|nr:hypothetical protein DAMA08_022060 [Martiniozyma asiatica]